MWHSDRTRNGRFRRWQCELNFGVRAVWCQRSFRHYRDSFFRYFNWRRVRCLRVWKSVLDPFDRGGETITFSRQGLDDPWSLRIVFKRFTNLLNSGVDRVIELDEATFFPKGLLNLRAGDKFSGSSRQKCKKTAWLILQSNPSPVLAEFGSVQIEFKRLETNPP